MEFRERRLADHAREFRMIASSSSSTSSAAATIVPSSSSWSHLNHHHHHPKTATTTEHNGHNSKSDNNETNGKHSKDDDDEEEEDDENDEDDGEEEEEAEGNHRFQQQHGRRRGGGGGGGNKTTLPIPRNGSLPLLPVDADTTRQQRSRRRRSPHWTKDAWTETSRQQRQQQPEGRRHLPWLVLLACPLLIFLFWNGQWTLLAAAVGMLILRWHWRNSRVKEESFLVVRDLGVQVTTLYFSGKRSSNFIDKSRIADIIINEGITFHKVIFYMAIVIENSDRMVVVFENMQPRLDILLKVYHGTRAVMYGEPEPILLDGDSSYYEADYL